MDNSQDLDQAFIKDLQLSRRTFNALHREGVFTVGKLRELLQDNKLEYVRYIGKKSLDEISMALRDWYKNKNTFEDKKTEKISDYLDSQELDRVFVNELNLPPRIRRALKRGGVFTVGNLRKLLHSKKLEGIFNIGQKSLDKISMILSDLYENPSEHIKVEKKPDSLVGSLVEQSYFEDEKKKENWSEIVQSYFESEKKTYSFVMLSRYGFNPKTLEEIASELGVTRERVRQIQEAAAIRFLKYMRLATDAKELLGKVSGILSFYGEDLSLKKFRETLKKEKILGEFSSSLVSERISKIDPFEALICWLGLLSHPKYSLEPVIFPVDINALIHSEDLSINEREILVGISSKTRRKIKRKVLFTGGIYIKDAIAILSANERVATLVLEELNLKKLDDSWYSLKTYDVGVDGEKIPLRVAGLKILSVASEVDFTVFCDGLRRHTNRFYAMLAPPDVLLYILPLLGFEVDSHYKVSTRLSVEGVLSKSENSLISAIAKSEGVASFFEIAEEFFLRKLSLPAVSVTLKRSPIVEKIDDGLYKLRGTEVAWQQVDAAQKRQKRFSQDDEVVYGLDGVIKMELTVNNYACLTGVIGIYKLRELSGSSWLVMHEKQPFGKAKMDDAYLWGLSKLFKELDIRIGQRIELGFNTRDKTMSIGKVENEH